jgi:hypothetical protein
LVYEIQLAKPRKLRETKNKSKRGDTNNTFPATPPEKSLMIMSKASTNSLELQMQSVITKRSLPQKGDSGFTSIV